jgi:hypothetical protein
VTRPLLFVLVQKLAAVCTVNLYCMSFSHVSYQYVVRMLCSTGVSASSPICCDSVKVRVKSPIKRKDAPGSCDDRAA